MNGGSDITKSGEQPSGINEGIIYAGIFEEDSAGGVVSKSLVAAASNGTNTANVTGSATAQRRTMRGQVGTGKLVGI